MIYRFYTLGLSYAAVRTLHFGTIDCDINFHILKVKTYMQEDTIVRSRVLITGSQTPRINR